MGGPIFEMYDSMRRIQRDNANELHLQYNDLAIKLAHFKTSQFCLSECSFNHDQQPSIKRFDRIECSLTNITAALFDSKIKGVHFSILKLRGSSFRNLNCRGQL